MRLTETPLSFSPILRMTGQLYGPEPCEYGTWGHSGNNVVPVRCSADCLAHPRRRQACIELGKHDRNQFVVGDGFMPLRDGPMVQFGRCLS